MEEKLKKIVNIYDKYYDDPCKICREKNIDINDYDYINIPIFARNCITLKFSSTKNNNIFTIIYLPYKNYVDEKILLGNNFNVIFSYKKSFPIYDIIFLMWNWLKKKPLRFCKNYKSLNELEIIENFDRNYLSKLCKIFNKYKYKERNIKALEKRALIRSIEKNILNSDVILHVNKYLSVEDVYYSLKDLKFKKIQYHQY